jgi:hypothetical protein
MPRDAMCHAMCAAHCTVCYSINSIITTSTTDSYEYRCDGNCSTVCCVCVEDFNVKHY